MGLYSPPQTPEARIEKSTVISLSRPQTPPPSTHHTQSPETPRTPTHHPLVHTEETSLFEDMAQMQPPPTPVLYNLIRNEGAQKFVAAAPPRNKDRIEGIGVTSAELTVVPEDDEEDTSLRGHPSACLFVARYLILNVISLAALIPPSPRIIFARVSPTSSAKSPPFDVSDVVGNSLER